MDKDHPHSEHKQDSQSLHKEPHNQVMYNDIKTLIAWSAPGRPFRKRSRQFYLSLILLVLPLEIIAFLFSQGLLMMVILSVVFLSMVLSSVSPRNFHFKITSEGIMVEDHFFIWEELYDFFFKNIEGVDVLHIRTRGFLPGELKLPLGDVSHEHLRRILINFLPYREYIKPTFMEKSADWLAVNFPLEK